MSAMWQGCQSSTSHNNDVKAKLLWPMQQLLQTACAHYACNNGPEMPQTVTQVFGVGSFERPPMRRSKRSDVHTRSHTKVGSDPSSDLRN